MRRVLFVDDEPQLLAGLMRMLYPLRAEWKMEYAAGGREALQRLSESEYDVIVTDIRMPEMSGIELLSEVIRLYPQMVRIVLSGTADHEMTLRSVSLAHQYLMKPCDSRTIRTTVENAFRLQNLLDEPSLKRLIGRITSLPSAPAVYFQLMAALKSNDVSTREIGSIIAQDLGMTAKVLQLVNSPLFGLSRVISGPEEAVVYLGVDTVRGLALTSSVFSQFEKGNHPAFSPGELRNHSFRVAMVAREIARAGKLPAQVAADVFLGGLMHDIGKLVLGSDFRSQYQEVVQCFDEPRAVRETEFRLFGTTHAEVGAYLLWLWGVPGSVTDIVARHHIADPKVPAASEPPAVVRLADAIVHDGWTAATRDFSCAIQLPGSALDFIEQARLRLGEAAI